MRIRRRHLISVCLLAASIVVLVLLSPLRHETVDERTDEADKIMRGMWVATVHNIDFPSSPNLSEAALKSELFEIVKKASDAGYNAIFFQVRPSCDALYNSAIFPRSKYLGTEFDALDYLCALGEKYGIQIHAWINPYRVTASEEDTPFVTEGIVQCGGKYYLDPGEPSNIELVCEGVREIVKNYPIDGIHFDDYFYPSTDFDDAASYSAYGEGMDIADWRRQNTYALISAVNQTIKSEREDVAFGVSPVGVWRNSSVDERGSDTRGYSGYDDIYADALAWAQDGLVDYLAPQIYWERGNKAADFTTLYEWWKNALKNTGTKLYIGIAAYKKYDFPEGEIEVQRDLAEKSGGYIMYNYSNCDFPSEKAGALTVAIPSDGTVMTENSTYVVGYADPALDVTVNGVAAERSPLGYYAAHVPLNDGKNKIEVKAGNQSKSIGVTVKHSTSSGEGNTAVTEKKGLIGRVKKEAILRSSPSSSGTRLGTLCEGVTDAVSAQSGAFSRLSCGWVLTSSLDITDGELDDNVTQDVVYTYRPKETEIAFLLDRTCPYDVNVASDIVEITLYGAKGTDIEFTYDKDPLIESMGYRQSGVDAVYTLHLRTDIGGYGVSASENGLSFVFKRKKISPGGVFPLAGFKIVVDAGHGGDDGGASSPGEYDEADLNLKVAAVLCKKLQKYGAQVIMTRTDDTYMSLADRASLIKEADPDIAISIHHNSAGYSADVTTVYGAMTLYSEDMSLGAAQAIQNGIVTTAGRADRGAKWQGLAVCRVTNCPSILAEMGFICNPFEYEELISERVIDMEAQGIADGVKQYFSK